MRIRFALLPWSLVLAWLAPLCAEGSDLDASLGSPGGWQRYDWLSPSPSGATATGAKITSTSGAAAGDPFAVVGTGALWSDKYGMAYNQPLPENLTFSYETSAATLSEDSNAFFPSSDGLADDLAHAQKGTLQFQPFQPLSLSGNVYDSGDDAGSPPSALETRGGGVTAEGHLPLNSVLTVGANSDTAATGVPAASATEDNSYDAQVKQPLGPLPVTAVIKGHYEETTQNGAAVTRLPSTEQSLIWKPADSATLQMGLRQQHYQNFPGVANDLNETIFADWSQTLMPEVTWHSYAEVLNTRGTEDIAPAAPVATGANGANGTPQASDPNASPTTSFSDETVTFSTGPSIKVDRDVSASIEYSNRIDRNPLPGTVGDEQRVSVSLKGTF
jgi:hypothetical protein